MNFTSNKLQHSWSQAEECLIDSHTFFIFSKKILKLLSWIDNLGMILVNINKSFEEKNVYYIRSKKKKSLYHYNASPAIFFIRVILSSFKSSNSEVLVLRDKFWSCTEHFKYISNSTVQITLFPLLCLVVRLRYHCYHK